MINLNSMEIKNVVDLKVRNNQDGTYFVEKSRFSASNETVNHDELSELLATSKNTVIV